MLIVDYSQIAIGSLMSEMKGNITGDVNVSLVRHMILNSLRGYRQKFHGEYGELVIACDSKKSWRKDVFPHYKANRKKDRDSSDIDWQSIYSTLNMVKEELFNFFPYAVVEVDLAEGDDVVAVLTEHVSPEPVLIISGDHDFVQLQRLPNVKQFSPVQKVWIKAEHHPDVVLIEHILSGDKGDGVPNFLTEDDVFVAGKRQKSLMSKKMEKWRLQPLSSWDNSPYSKNIERNKQLIDLSMIPENIKSEIIEKYNSQKTKNDRSALLDYFNTYKMKHMVEHLTEF